MCNVFEIEKRRFSRHQKELEERVGPRVSHPPPQGGSSRQTLAVQASEVQTGVRTIDRAGNVLV